MTRITATISSATTTRIVSLMRVDYVVWRKGGPLVNDPTPGVQPGDYAYWRARYGNAALGDFKPRMDLCGGLTCARIRHQAAS